MRKEMLPAADGVEIIDPLGEAFAAGKFAVPFEPITTIEHESARFFVGQTSVTAAQKRCYI